MRKKYIFYEKDEEIPKMLLDEIELFDRSKIIVEGDNDSDVRHKYEEAIDNEASRNESDVVIEIAYKTTYEWGIGIVNHYRLKPIELKEEPIPQN